MAVLSWLLVVGVGVCQSHRLTRLKPLNGRIECRMDHIMCSIRFSSFVRSLSLENCHHEPRVFEYAYDDPASESKQYGDGNLVRLSNSCREARPINTQILTRHLWHIRRPVNVHCQAQTPLSHSVRLGLFVANIAANICRLLLGLEQDAAAEADLHGVLRPLESTSMTTGLS